MLKDVAFARKIARERLAPVVHDVPLGQTKVKMLAEIATLLKCGSLPGPALTGGGLLPHESETIRV